MKKSDSILELSSKKDEICYMAADTSVLTHYNDGELSYSFEDGSILTVDHNGARSDNKTAIFVHSI